MERRILQEMGFKLGTPSSSSMKFALFFSLSLAVASHSTSAIAFSADLSIRKLNFRLYSSLAPPRELAAASKATAADLISLLGPTQQSSAISSGVAEELRACFKFLVPFIAGSESLKPPLHVPSWELSRSRSRQEENELVWWPPEPVMELARLAVDSGGDPGAIHWALDPTIIPEINSYLTYLFEMIVRRGPEVGLNVSLNRYDFFHGHLFLATNSQRLGILFHAKEYPAYDKEVFPVNMGYCQIGSNVAYDDSMNLRNVLWLAPLPSESINKWLAPGVLVVLDAHPGGIIYRDLIPDYVSFVRTLYEDDFGQTVVDVNYLNVGNVAPEFQLFIC